MVDRLTACPAAPPYSRPGPAPPLPRFPHPGRLPGLRPEEARKVNVPSGFDGALHTPRLPARPAPPPSSPPPPPRAHCLAFSIPAISLDCARKNREKSMFRVGSMGLCTPPRVPLPARDPPPSNSRAPVHAIPFRRQPPGTPSETKTESIAASRTGTCSSAERPSDPSASDRDPSSIHSRSFTFIHGSGSGRGRRPLIPRRQGIRERH
jgi:hypothetical protein